MPKLKPVSSAPKLIIQKSGRHPKDRRKSAVPVSSSYHHEVFITTTQPPKSTKMAPGVANLNEGSKED